MKGALLLISFSIALLFLSCTNPVVSPPPKAPTIYSGGFYNDGSKTVPCYWKGTARTDLGDGTHDTYVYAMSVVE